MSSMEKSQKKAEGALIKVANNYDIMLSVMTSQNTLIKDQYYEIAQLKQELA